VIKGSLYRAAFAIARTIAIDPLHRHHRRRVTLQKLGRSPIPAPALLRTRGRIPPRRRAAQQRQRTHTWPVRREARDPHDS